MTPLSAPRKLNRLGQPRRADMRTVTIAALALLALAATGSARADVAPAAAAGAPKIALPQDGDEYSALVARAAAGDNAVDLRALRFAWLKSKARQRGVVDIAALRKSMFSAVEAGQTQRVR